jgi:hypothetical protein
MLSGGKVLDQGMYGCIFKPELECKDKKKQPKPTGDKDHPPLSKLILKDDAILEYNISKIIRGIPIWKNYFAVAESICDPAPEKQQKKKERDFHQCDVLQKYPFADFRILSMSYYGVTMANFRFKIPQFDFMKFASHLIQAGALLNLFGVVHRDIHQGNILIDTHHIPRIIVRISSTTRCTSHIAFHDSVPHTTCDIGYHIQRGLATTVPRHGQPQKQ